MKMRDTEHGLMFLRDDREPFYMDVIWDDPKYGTGLLIGTGHASVAVRVTPGGRKVTAKPSSLTPRALIGDNRE